MRFSQFYAPTLKEAPADAEVPSQELLTRAGFIRKIAAGVYTYLPLGRRVLLKIEKIVREEMDNIGANEILMPIIQPAELWKQSGRWEDYGPEMMKLKDRHGRDFTLGPTHEELVTFLVQNELNSYKQLPITLYQMANKYRDEIRPRFGVLRAREFIMKDGYSFHSDWESLDETYKAHRKAYSNIMERIGLKYAVVEASSGAIGGNESHEFVAFADTGESNVLFCECGYAGNDERVPYTGEIIYDNEELKGMEKVYTPNVKTAQDVADFLGVPVRKIVKTLIYKGRNGYFMALVPGDRELNEEKLKNFLNDQSLAFATPDDILKDFGVPIGFLGPVGVKGIKVIADHLVKGMKNFVVGGMEKDYHFVNVNVDRDFKVDELADLIVTREGDPCPVCGKPLNAKKGIELGHIFKLGTKYSEAMGSKYMDKDGQLKPFIMGCYGWGVSRTLGAIVEQLHDEKGIIWPLSVAPFAVVITPVSNNENLMKFSEELYNFLVEKGEEVLLDDRNISPGMKFNDADLIGIPFRVTVGKALSEGMVEIKWRTGQQFKVKATLEEIYEFLQKSKQEYDPHKRVEK
ncbi:proline--tRNA ligase [Fervidobacterium nodosum]|uniref:Proline--tRNA ligase n=1 Tax=Fervidobacterium nodosum (strain ATCC 35602 / DSM 5306 / Rt17-B1) TaxID=381764 RepID=SYP_FERNB|nr:proline--tRNA ligase [Fervidobacterium nodosum]A7HKV2.1 RecName: Full=Proline--tRNA ligase; AltName: Full=Prolyl-tRNA synthetase; Short=ProRS [Fervidobacterium nodosum Rt17-B1]ABS60535.1 prolyl-tRNA synthetase [Fervidobacterium nodosum Rt17-B1]